MSPLAEIRQLAVYGQGEKYGELARRLDEILKITNSEPRWTCPRCSQDNCSWAAECGRCDAPKPLNCGEPLAVSAAIPPTKYYALFITGLCGIRTDGTVEYEKGYTPDAAAKQLWEAIGRMQPLLQHAQGHRITQLEGELAEARNAISAALALPGARFSEWGIILSAVSVATWPPPEGILNSVDREKRESDTALLDWLESYIKGRPSYANVQISPHLNGLGSLRGWIESLRNITPAAGDAHG